MPVTEKSIKEGLSKFDFAKVKVQAAKSFDLSEIPDDKLEKVLHIAVHCCLNGPVGVNKDTNFPGLEYKGSIKQLLPTVTSSRWNGFLHIIAKEIPMNDVTSSCYTVAKFGSFWPFCSGKFTPKVKENK